MSQTIEAEAPVKTIGAGEPTEEQRKLGYPAPGQIGTLNGPSPLPGLKINSIGGMAGFCPCGCASANGNSNPLAFGGAPTLFYEFSAPGGVPQPPTGSQTNYADALSWEAGPRQVFDETTDTGSRAVTRSPVLEDWEAYIVIMNDARISPVVLARWGLVGAGIVAAQNFINAGVRMTLIHGNPQNYPTPNIDGGLITPDFWWTACAQLVVPSVRINAIGKKFVVTSFKMVSGGSPLYHLPYAFPQLQQDIASWGRRYKGF